MSHTILAVDDSPSMRHMIGHVLRTAGFRVIEAGTAEEALGAAARERVDAVIADLDLPGMEGLGLVRRLRALDRHADTPIVVLARSTSHDLSQRGHEAGATGWMEKPLDPVRLVEMCRRIVR